MAASAVQMAKATGAIKVVAEQVSVGSFTKKDGSKGAGNLQSALALSEAHGAIRYALRPLGLVMTTFNLSSARAQLGIRTDLGIKGAPKKDDVRRWLTAQGFPTVNGDEADALVIWLAVHLGKAPAMPTPQARPRRTITTQPSQGTAWLQG
jgi:hypothetical protein